MRFSLVINCLLGLPVAGLAQRNLSPSFVTENARGITDVFNNGFDIVSYDLRSKEVKGTPMLQPNWAQGEILLVGNQKPTPAVLKYDVYHQYVQVRRRQGDSIAVPVSRIESFSFVGLLPDGALRKRQFVRCESPQLPTQFNATCAEVISQDDHAQLLKFWTKELSRTTESSTNITAGNSVYSFFDSQKYYLKLAGTTNFVAIKPKRGSLKEALASQPAAQKQLDEYKGSISNETELVAALAAVAPVLIIPVR